MSQIIIAKNITAGPAINLSLENLSAPDAQIPASGQVELTLYNGYYDIREDQQIFDYITNDQVILNDGTQDLSKSESLDALSVYQHPNHTGDVTSVGDGVITVADNVITNAKLANVSAMTLKGNNTGSTADPQDLTVADVLTMLGVGHLFQKIQTSGPQDLNTGTATVISFDSNPISNPPYTATSDTVTTFNEDGIYVVTYNVNLLGGSNRRNVRTWAQINGSGEVAMSRSASYTRNSSDDRANNVASFPIQVTAGDTISFFGQQDGSSGSSNSIVSQTGFFITKVS